MSYLLTDPRAVVLVGEPTDTLTEVRAVLKGGLATDVIPAETTEGVSEILADRDDVGCIVVIDGRPEFVDTVCDVAATAEESNLLPVVAYVADEAVAATAAHREACRYLPPSVGTEKLAAVVDDALEDYERRRRESAESSLFRTLLERGELPLFAKDCRGRHVYKSDLEDDVYTGSVIGKTDVEVTPDDARETAETALDDDLQVVETGDPRYDVEYCYQYGGGHEHWSLATKIPWRGDDGSVKGLVGFSRDITLRKRYQQRLEEQAERIDQFISYVSHDLRTPLQIIYGATDLARDGDETAIDTIEKSTERIQNIVDDLGHISEDGNQPGLASNTLRSVQAESLSTEIVPLVDEVWPVIAPAEAALQFEIPEETIVSAEVETIRPVLENLLKNAIDHAGPDVTVRIGATETNDLYVADDGPGIPERDRQKVLEPGYTTTAEGTGTGLDIVAQMLEKQRWDLSITESTDGGARFEIGGIALVTSPDAGVRPTGEITLDESVDVGEVGIPGDAAYDGETDRWTVVGNGKNVWGNVHEFHYVYGEAEAPVRIEGRIEHLDGVEEFTKAGFAVRGGLDPSAPFGYVGTTEGHGSEVTWRGSSDGFTESTQFEELPDTFPWYRVDYVDGRLTCWLSEDDDRWVPVDQRSIDLGERVTVGLLACSHSRRQTCEATFADVRACKLEQR